MATFEGNSRGNSHHGSEQLMLGRGGDDSLSRFSNQPGALFGGSGDDQLTAGTAGDFLSGGSGNDSLSGSDASDILRGGRGADTLNGGEGIDTLTGGRGRDTFVIDFGIRGPDTITDFQPGHDTLRIVGVPDGMTIIYDPSTGFVTTPGGEGPVRPPILVHLDPGLTLGSHDILIA